MGLLEWWYADGEQERSDSLDLELARINAKALADGKYTQEQFDAAEANREAGQLNVDDSLNESFIEGAKEGADNIRNKVGGAINEVTGLTFRIIPWQVWFLAALALFIWLGGIPLTKGALNKK